MDSLHSWLNKLQCPDCRGSLTAGKGESDHFICESCGRDFFPSKGIWSFLPTVVIKREEKDREKSGWTQKTEDGKEKGWDPQADHFLSLPNHPHPYYQAAAWYLKIIMEYGKPWRGKRVLELGAAECWGTRRFAESGCHAVALDYDPTRMLKGQILLDNLPIKFGRITGDAEVLPFKDNSLDGIFCCSVLHHFFDLPKAVREISRVLKPGGRFFGIHEAFHPPYYSKRRILEMSEDTIPNIAAGINESSYTLRFYRKTFNRAGLELAVLHPRWDVTEHGEFLSVAPGLGIYGNTRYVPEMLSGRAWRSDLPGALARVLLRSGIWRLAANPFIFPLIRFHILNWTVKDKLLVARKPV